METKKSYRLQSGGCWNATDAQDEKKKFSDKKYVKL